MDIKTFYETIDKIPVVLKEGYRFSGYLSKYFSVQEMEELGEFIYLNSKESIFVTVNDYEVMDKYIKLNTDLGIYFVEKSLYLNCEKINYGRFRLNNLFISKKYDLVTFFESIRGVFHNYNKYDNCIKNGCFFQKYFIDYVEYYNLYKMILNPEEYAKSLYLNCNKNYMFNYSLVPIDYLVNEEFYHYRYLNKCAFRYWKNIYDNCYQFDCNFRLLFSIIFSSYDKSKLDVIQERFEEVRQFLFEISSKPASSIMKSCYLYLKEFGLLERLFDLELLELYKNQPNLLYQFDYDKFIKYSSQIVNDSPLLKLNSCDDKMVHLEYRDYDVYDGVPVEFFKKVNVDEEKNPEFIDYYLGSSADSMKKFYNIYYNSYRKQNEKNGNFQKNNMEDFIKCLLNYKNLVKICYSHRFSWEDIEALKRFANCFGVKYKNNFVLIEKERRNFCLNFYNSVVRLKDNFQELDAYLKENGIDLNNIYDIILKEKWLYSKEKAAILNIFNTYYGNYIRVVDILELMDEMLSNEMTLDEILTLKNIPKKEFKLIYEKAKIDNPILYQCIFESLSKNSRRGYIKLLRFAQMVSNSQLSSLSEYEEKFGDVMSFSELLRGVKNTSLYDDVMNKTSSWNDFQYNDILIKGKKLG